MLSIQTNVDSLSAQQNLSVNSQFMSRTIQQLTSGYRINQSGDDAAGLAVANVVRDNIAQVTQGVANGNDGVAQLQIMDGGMSNISQILDRLQTLATQSASASFTGDRTTLNNEFQTDIQEINRQAQSIGLNTGGTFAKNLAVYLGGGAGTSSGATLTNGTVNVNLGQSAVDAQSLGLSGVLATNTTAYNLASSSATSVQAILTNVGNTTSPGGTSNFTFTGPGFGDVSGVTINVNLTGVANTTDLVNNINAAIQNAGQQATGAAGAFKAAGITASIVTNASGGQQLAFTSSTAAFSVTSGDLMASALMGSFSGAPPVGNPGGFSLISGGSSQLASSLTWGADLAGTENQVITVAANDSSGNAHTLSVTIGAAAQTMTQALTLINQKLQQTNDSTLQQITAVQTAADANPGGSFNFMSTLPGFTISVGASATAADGVQNNVGSSVTSTTVGTGSTSSINTLQGATTAVSAVSAAVSALGSAQAAIGKGENQLNYAINLASSQITNFSAAEKQIRDADVAQQAANLTKAQVLQQASIAAMAQANSAPQAVLALLKG